VNHLPWPSPTAQLRDRFDGARIRGRTFADVLLDDSW
jgi:hypothetical protein